MFHVPDWLKGLVGGSGLAAILGAAKARQDRKDKAQERLDHQKEYERSQSFTELSETVLRLQGEITAMSQAYTPLAQRVGALETENATLREDYRKLKAHGEQREKENKARIVKLEAENRSLRESNTDLQAKVDHLHGEIGEIHAIRTDVKDLHIVEAIHATGESTRPE